jgi:hypothetical protein
MNDLRSPYMSTVLWLCSIQPLGSLVDKAHPQRYRYKALSVNDNRYSRPMRLSQRCRANVGVIDRVMVIGSASEDER